MNKITNLRVITPNSNTNLEFCMHKNLKSGEEIIDNKFDEGNIPDASPSLTFKQSLKSMMAKDESFITDVKNMIGESGN